MRLIRACRSAISSTSLPRRVICSSRALEAPGHYQRKSECLALRLTPHVLNRHLATCRLTPPSITPPWTISSTTRPTSSQQPPPHPTPPSPIFKHQPRKSAVTWRHKMIRLPTSPPTHSQHESNGTSVFTLHDTIKGRRLPTSRTPSSPQPLPPPPLTRPPRLNGPRILLLKHQRGRNQRKSVRLPRRCLRSTLIGPSLSSECECSSGVQELTPAPGSFAKKAPQGRWSCGK